MRILATQFTLSMNSFDIYISGCNPPHCKGCHNPESWDFDQGEVYCDTYVKKLSDKLEDFDSLIKNIMIFGGEPLDSPVDDLVDLLKTIKIVTNDKPIWLFTRYELEEVPDSIKLLCSYIKCGRYEEENKVDDNEQYGIILATSNQKIYKKGVDY